MVTMDMMILKDMNMRNMNQTLQEKKNRRKKLDLALLTARWILQRGMNVKNSKLSQFFRRQ